MKVTVIPSSVSGTLEAPPSKSITQRAIAAGLLARGITTIERPSHCSDSRAALGMAQALGSVVRNEGGRIIIATGSEPEGPVTLNCGESGLALRMFAPVSALLAGRVTLTGEGSLMRRPVEMICEALPQLGVTVHSRNGFLPVTLTGRLKGGEITIDGSAGSQLLTGLLTALPLADDDSRIEVKGLTSRPYIDLTIELLDRFGVMVKNEEYRIFTIRGRQSYQAGEYLVEGDWSGAAFMLVAGATANATAGTRAGSTTGTTSDTTAAGRRAGTTAGGTVTVTNLSSESRQADREVLTALRDAGASVVTGDGGISISASALKPFIFDATDSPDLFPPLAALAASCSGTSIIKGVSRLRHKESDRAGAILEILGALKIGVRIIGNEMHITGGRVEGAEVSSHNDHRIAMMAAIMGVVADGPVIITGTEAVNKSYPEFFNDLSHLGAAVRQ